MELDNGNEYSVDVLREQNSENGNLNEHGADKMQLNSENTGLPGVKASMLSIVNSITKLDQAVPACAKNEISHGVEKLQREDDLVDGRLMASVEVKSEVNVFESIGEMKMKQRHKGNSDSSYEKVDLTRNLASTEHKKISKKDKGNLLYDAKEWLNLLNEEVCYLIVDFLLLDLLHIRNIMTWQCKHNAVKKITAFSLFGYFLEILPLYCSFFTRIYINKSLEMTN